MNHVSRAANISHLIALHSSVKGQAPHVMVKKLNPTPTLRSTNLVSLITMTRSTNLVFINIHPEVNSGPEVKKIKIF